MWRTRHKFCGGLPLLPQPFHLSLLCPVGRHCRAVFAPAAAQVTHGAGGTRRIPMAKIHRREFAKRAAAAAVAAPLLLENFGQQTTEAPKPEPKLKLSADQEVAVKKAVERRDQQLKKMRDLVLPYDLEPAFVFAARPKARGGRRE